MRDKNKIVTSDFVKEISENYLLFYIVFHFVGFSFVHFWHVRTQKMHNLEI